MARETHAVQTLERAKGLINQMMVTMSNVELDDEFKSDWYKKASEFMYPEDGPAEYVLQALNGKFIAIGSSSGYPHETNVLRNATIWDNPKEMTRFMNRFPEEKWAIREITVDTRTDNMFLDL